MYLLRYALLFLLGCCFLVEAAAQTYRASARRYGIAEGLPHRQVNSVMQDRRGFIWAATSGGVVRFDGRRFRTFNKTESGLGGDIVAWVAEDAESNILVCHYGANAWFDIINPLSGSVTAGSIFFRQAPPVPWATKAYQPQYLADGTLVIGFLNEQGFALYHPRKGWIGVRISGCKNFQPVYVSRAQTIWGICNDEKPGYSWLMEVDTAGQVLQRIEPEAGHGFMLKKGETASKHGFFVQEIGPNWSQPVLWEIGEDGSRRQALSYAKVPFSRQHAQLGDSQIQVEFPLLWEADAQELIDISRQFPEIDGTQYLDYLCDRSGNVWFATTFGLIVIELRQNLFRRLLYQENVPGGRGLPCRGLLEKNGRLIVNVETFGQHRFLVNPQTGAAQTIFGESGMGIAGSGDGNIWTECNTDGIGWWHISLQKTTPDGRPLGPPFLQRRDAALLWSILEEKPSRVLLGHISGMSVYNPQAGMATPLTDARFPTFSRAAIYWLQRDHTGQIWACTDQGLYRLEPGEGVAERFWSGGTEEHYLPYDNITHVYEDKEGVFWLGTGGGGLLRWDRNAPPSKRVQTIFHKNGLLNGVVYATYEDAHQHLWLPTDYGIVQLDKTTCQVRRTWLMSDGLTNNEFNRISHCQGADGTLYFGGLNGVTAFRPDDFYRENLPSQAKNPLVVTDFAVFDESAGKLENRSAGLLHTNRIELHPGDRYCQLEFALLDYIAPEKVTYAWLLEGLNPDWQTLTEPVLRLSSLPYGSHHLRIRAQAADGTWAGNELNIAMEVLPPVYLRWWFILMALAALATAIWGWFYWRVRAHQREQARLEAEVSRQTATIRQQAEALKKLDEAKNRFFANVSHELRTPLTLILGPLASLLKGSRLDSRDLALARTARQHGRQLLQLVNEILDLSKLEASKMKVQETAVSLQPFLRRVVGSFESHAERLGILFLFEYLVAARLRVFVDADKLQKILNNLLSNALKFTPPHAGGMVSVRVEEVENHIRIVVHDTGRGIHPDDLPHVFERFYQSSQADAPIEGGTGIGLALCRELAEVMEGRIWVESRGSKADGEEATGASFYFEFPKKEVFGVGEESNDEADRSAHPGFMEDGTNKEVEAPENHPSVTPQVPGIDLKAQRPTLLLVEDNESLRDYVQLILEEKYQVVAAENGRAALAWLTAEGGSGRVESKSNNPSTFHPPPSTFYPPPSLIISDVMMPVMDGFQLLESLKGDDRFRHIPVVMLTARAELRDRLRALRTGVDDYLLKPFEEEELLARVDNLLKNYRNRQIVDEPVTHQEDALEAEHLPQTISAEDQRWLEDFEQLVEARLGDFHLTADMLAEAMAMSRAPFFRQLKRVTGLTPAQYLDEARFQKARQLLERRDVSSVKAAAYTVGFRQVKHFSQNYKKRFGRLPSEAIG